MNKLITLIAAPFLLINYSQAFSQPTRISDNSAVSGLEKFRGDWVGSGWGWEVRFKQSAESFIKQFPVVGELDLPFEGEKHIMSLMVTHTTNFYFTIEADGNVHGEGTIIYGVVPNLCGLAALTKQVNEAINLMAKIPAIFKWAAQISNNLVKTFNREWYEEEAKLAKSLNEFSTVTSNFGRDDIARPLTEAEFRHFLMQWYKDNSATPDVRSLAATILFNRCSTGTYNFGTGLSCTVLGNLPVAEDIKSLGEMALEEAVDQVMDKLSSTLKKKMQGIDLEAQKNEQLCLSGAGITTASGIRVGPTTLEELIMEFGPELVNAAIFDSALGNPPIGMMLSIPGITQVQYYYKGLKEGPETRKFKIKGNLVLLDGLPKLFLEKDGDVYDGSKNLTLEYMVNYKKENPQFPVWSPFLKVSGDAYESGTETVYERKTLITKKDFIDPVTNEKITIDIPEEVTTKKDIYQNTPYANFREVGMQRNNVSVWHEYEYIWNAHKITEPRN